MSTSTPTRQPFDQQPNEQSPEKVTGEADTILLQNVKRQYNVLLACIFIVMLMIGASMFMGSGNIQIPAVTTATQSTQKTQATTSTTQRKTSNSRRPSKRRYHKI